MGLRDALKQNPGKAALAGVVLLAAGGFGFYWFGPHLLFINQEVAEATPGGAGMTTLGSGEFKSLEHATKGKAMLLDLGGGKRVLRLENLDTSNGPDLRVYLSTVEAQDDWRIYGQKEFIDLGALKGNRGNANYDLPSGTEPAKFKSAVVWCRRFGVAFGVAPLDRQ